MYFFLSVIWLGFFALLGFISTQSGIDGIMASIFISGICAPCLVIVTDKILYSRR